jgi:predicted ATPase/class 3 adenylate cyclase
MAGSQTSLSAASPAEGEEYTLIFTDIEGSTGLVEHLGDRYPEALFRQFSILRHAMRKEGGEEVGTHGDEFFAAFQDPAKAIAFAVEAQRQLYDAEWPAGATVRVRMGVHTGKPVKTLSPRLDFSGLDVHRAARIANAGHGGQILISKETWERIEGRLPPGIETRGLGTFKLKDIRFPEALYDLTIEGLPTTFAPIRSTEGRPGNLPADLTPFIGRTTQTAAVETALMNPKTRMVTITGTGGSGKTRLAIETARRIEGKFKDGAFLVSMAPIGSPRLMAPAIAQSLGIPEQHGRPVQDIIKGAIGAREILLVIDNFEHVIPAASHLPVLLASCPGLKILVTSREALGISPEHEYPLTPMETPKGETAPDDLAEVEAIAFFLDRAQAIRPDFELDDRNTKTVAEICRHLDGLPLAIELAASRLRLLDPDQLLKRLDERLEALGRDDWSLSGRHKTMRNAIGWSYNLLTEPERAIFSAAAVFSGSFTVEALAEVARVPRKLALETVDSLVRKSLLQRAAVDGELRLSLLSLIKDYGIEQTKEGDSFEDLKERHLDQVVTLVEKNSDPLLSPGTMSGARVLIPEVDNIRAALERAIETRNAPAIATLLKHLLWFWISRSQFLEAEAWISRALLATGDLIGAEERAVVTDVAGWHHVLAGDWGAALPHFGECRLAYQRLDLSREEAFARMMEGITGFISSGQGLSAVEASLLEFRAKEDAYGIGIALTALGEAARLEGRHAEAQPLLEEALSAMRKLGNAYWTVAILQNLAHVHISFGDWRLAATLLRQALELGQASEDTSFAHYYVSAMGQVAVLSGDLELAAKLFGSIEKSMETTGFRFEPADHRDYETARAAIGQKLGIKGFALRIDEGRRWSLEDAITAAYAFRAP